MNTQDIAVSSPLGQGRKSQNDLVLAVLKTARPGDWVAMPLLVEASGSYVVHSRISDLRNRGWQIEQRNERHGRQIHSFYRLANLEPQFLVTVTDQTTNAS